MSLVQTLTHLKKISQEIRETEERKAEQKGKYIEAQPLDCFSHLKSQRKGIGEPAYYQNNSGSRRGEEEDRESKQESKKVAGMARRFRSCPVGSACLAEAASF